MKKKKWRWGPKLPPSFPNSHFCSTALNSTSALFVGGRHNRNNIEKIPSIYDFGNHRWGTGPSIDGFSNKYKGLFIESCALTMLFGKQNEQKVIALMKTDGMYL